MDEEKINVAKAPSFILSFCHGHRMLSSVVVIPNFGGHKDIFAFDQPFADGSADALAGFLLVLIIVGAIKQPVSRFDGL